MTNRYMICKDEITGILEKYSRNQLTIGVLGAHSALEVCRGPKTKISKR